MGLVMVDWNEVKRGAMMVDIWDFLRLEFEAWDGQRPKVDVSQDEMTKVFALTSTDANKAARLPICWFE